MIANISHFLGKVTHSIAALPIYVLGIIALIVIGVGITFLYISMRNP